MSNNVNRMHSREDIDSELELVDYAAGRLDDARRAAFERRLASDEGLAAKLDEERDLRAALVRHDTDDMPDAGAFERIAGKLEDGPRRTSQWQMPALAAAIVAVIAVGFMMQVPVDDRPSRGDFETLSNDGAQPVDTANRVRVVFAKDADANVRAAVAKLFGFEIVSGPGPGGAFVVETADEPGREILSQWREDPRIELAEPVRYD